MAGEIPNGNGVKSLVHGLFASKLLPIAGTVIVLLLTALGALFLRQADAQLADHQRWLVYLQTKHDALQSQSDTIKNDQARRQPMVEAAVRLAELVQVMRVDIATIKEQQLYTHQVITRLEQLGRRQLRAVEESPDAP